ncbi:MAG: hypothetical protein SVV03_06515 [Candidatus Nanohaloarchaea archaeon]|nr:hypothetical protein [Candidatus Nanohaloarchaea archaeon]
MVGKIEIEVEDDGQMSTNSSFDLATTAVVLEKVKQQLVGRAQIQLEGEGQDSSEEEEDEE